jgi:hypothetical protein
MFARPQLNRKKLGVAGHACHPSDSGKLKRRTVVPASMGKK